MNRQPTIDQTKISKLAKLSLLSEQVLLLMSVLAYSDRRALYQRFKKVENQYRFEQLALFVLFLQVVNEIQTVLVSQKLS